MARGTPSEFRETARTCESNCRNLEVHCGRLLGSREHNAQLQQCIREPKETEVSSDPVQPVGYFINTATGQFLPLYEYPQGCKDSLATKGSSNTQAPGTTALVVLGPSTTVSTASTVSGSSANGTIPLTAFSELSLIGIASHARKRSLKEDRETTHPTSRHDATDASRSRRIAKPKAMSSRRVRSPSTSTNSYLGDENEDGSSKTHVVTVPTQTFYIADLDGVKSYFRARLHELTLNPLRKIIEGWIKMIEPRRTSLFGKYGKFGKNFHLTPKQAAVQAPEAVFPTWWVEDCQYREPSHLKRHEVEALFIQIILLHRYPAETQRIGIVNWVQKLATSATRSIEAMPDESFASSKIPVYNFGQKERALKEILPELFDVAKAHEDHFAAYGADGDVSQSAQYTWKPASKPPRGEPARSRRRMETPEEIDDEGTVYVSPSPRLAALSIVHSPQASPGLSTALRTSPQIKKASPTAGWKASPNGDSKGQITPSYVRGMDVLAIETPQQTCTPVNNQALTPPAYQPSPWSMIHPATGYPETPLGHSHFSSAASDGYSDMSMFSSFGSAFSFSSEISDDSTQYHAPQLC